MDLLSFVVSLAIILDMADVETPSWRPASAIHASCLSCSTILVKLFHLGNYVPEPKRTWIRGVNGEISQQAKFFDPFVWHRPLQLINRQPTQVCCNHLRA